MNRFLLVVTMVGAISALLIIFTPAAFSADKDQSYFFIGLWEGIDPADGSEVLVSISDNNDDGELELLWHENRWFSCNGSDNAVLTATGGTVEDDVLSFETAIISCFDTNTDEEIDDSPLTFQSNRKANIIFNGNIALHRIGSGPWDRH